MLKGKVALITGAGSGLGQAMARFFCQQGAQVCITGRRLERLEATRALVRQDGHDLLCVRADVSVAEDCRRLVDAIVAAFGRLDCAVNNAAVEPRGALLADITEQHFREIMDTNLIGVWHCMRHEIPAMIASGGGSIVNVSSSTASPTIPTLGHYSAAKAGLENLTKTAAWEYGANNIRVNTLIPGPIDTEMLRHSMAELAGIQDDAEMSMDEIIARKPEVFERFKKGLAMPRLGLSVEVAQAAAWLCSDLSSYTTGCKLPVDGGHCLRGAGNI